MFGPGVCTEEKKNFVIATVGWDFQVNPPPKKKEWKVALIYTK